MISITLSPHPKISLQSIYLFLFLRGQSVGSGQIVQRYGKVAYMSSDGKTRHRDFAAESEIILSSLGLFWNMSLSVSSRQTLQFCK